MVVLVDVEHVLVDDAVVIGIVLVVIAAGLETYMTVLHVSKDRPCLINIIGCLQEDVAVLLVGWRVIVLVSAVLQQQVAQLAVLDVCQVAEMVAVVVLHGQSADDVPAVVLVVGIPDETVGVLLQPLFAHEVHLLVLLAVAVGEVLQSVFSQFVLVAELLIVAVAIGVVQ